MEWLQFRTALSLPPSCTQSKSFHKNSNDRRAGRWWWWRLSKSLAFEWILWMSFQKNKKSMKLFHFYFSIHSAVNYPVRKGGDFFSSRLDFPHFATIKILLLGGWSAMICVIRLCMCALWPQVEILLLYMLHQSQGAQLKERNIGFEHEICDHILTTT